MDEVQMNRLLMQKVGRKFYGHDTLNSKYDPQIPASAEREYVRTTNAYMAILRTELEEQLPRLKEVYKENRDAEVRENRRNDSATDLMLAVSQIFTTIKNNVIARTIGFGLRRKLESLAHLNRKLTVKEWKKAIKATLGIDIREDYYLGDFYVEQLKKWVEENVGLISSIPEDTLEKMKDIVYDGFTNGKTTTRIVKDIQRAYGISRRRAELIARDQTAKLNGQIQKAQQQDAGITEYIWSDCGDERVRKSHRELNGRKFSWDDPPENSDGRKCHPGQDFQCRCIGRPVFNRNINLPVAGDVEIHTSVRQSISERSEILTKDQGMERMKSVSEGMGDLSLYSEHFITADPEWKKAEYCGAFYDAIGYNNLPKVVSETDFAEITSKYPIQYRGVQSRQQVEDFMFGRRYIGGGANGIGNNVSSDVEIARSYAEKDNILTMKLSSDAKVIKDTDLIEFVRTYRGAFSKENGVLRFVATDPGTIAASLGYDAIEDTSTGWLNILNRSKVIVKKNGG